MRQTFIIAAAGLALSLGGCKKDEKGPEADDKKDEPTTTKTEENPCAGKEDKNPCAAKPDPLAHVPTDPSANYAVAKVSHAEPKEGDPVHVVFDKIEVKKVDVKDTSNLEGATAEIEIALGELASGVADRDKHLKSADFFDAAKNPKAAVKISDVKKAGDNKYNAQAEITAMGQTQKWPVSFEVVEAKDDWVRIKGTHKFKRSDFKIGEGVQGPADDVELELHLTLKKS